MSTNFSSHGPLHTTDTFPPARSVGPAWRRFVTNAADWLILSVSGGGIGTAFFDTFKKSSSANPSSRDSLHATDTLPPARSVGPAWRRFVAYAVDWLTLSILGGGIGQVFFATFSQLGLWARLVGFCTAVAYFASFDSRLGNGQTLGKRWLRLRVVDSQGDTISFTMALFRSVILVVPTFLYDLGLPETRTPWIVSSIIFVVVLWVGGSILLSHNFQSSDTTGTPRPCCRKLCGQCR